MRRDIPTGELRKAITRRQHDLYFVAFDLLHLNGHDLRDMPLIDRHDILEALIPEGQRIQFSQALPGDAKSIFHLIDQAGLEGMVSKRKAFIAAEIRQPGLRANPTPSTNTIYSASNGSRANRHLPSWPSAARGVMLARHSSR